jgi:hypothetical protein
MTSIRDECLVDSGTINTILKSKKIIFSIVSCRDAC